MSAFFHELLSCFFLCILNPILINCLLGLLCCLHHHRMKYCCLGRVHHVCCLLLEYPRLFRRHECLFLLVLLCFWYFLFVWMMSRSILRCVVWSIFSCCCSVCPGIQHSCNCDHSVVRSPEAQMRTTQRSSIRRRHSACMQGGPKNKPNRCGSIAGIRASSKNASRHAIDRRGAPMDQTEERRLETVEE